jgi:hypothetical protein
MDDLAVPGYCGSIGPFGSAEYCQPHVYARDITSGAGNCVCGSGLGDELHVEAAPGVPVPEVMRMVAKSAEPQRFVLGIAYQAGPDPRIQRGVDGGRDYFTKAELEKACWSYMRSGAPQMNAFHVDGTEDCAEPVESFIWRWPDWDTGDGIVVKDGDWCLGAILSPRMWALHKAGKVNGLSPEGTARRRRVAKEGAVAIAKDSAVTDDDDDEMTELTDASFRKVALVGSGANGIPRFLIAKDGAEAGLIDAATVRDLIAKSPQEAPVTDASARERVVTPNGLTLTGSPKDIAAFIHAASVRKQADEPADPGRSGGPAVAAYADAVAKAAAEYDAIVKAKYNAADRKAMAGHEAMEDGSYPIKDEADLDNAIHAVGRGSGSHEGIRKHIIARAKSLGKSSKIPDNWNADGSLKGDVAKEAPVAQAVTKDMMDAAGDSMPLDDGMDGLDPTVPLAMPDDEMDAPGDPTDPGSPAWEAVDAASGQKWLSIAARFKNALCMLAEREMLEAASADPSDAENALDLEDAAAAIDYVIDTLAMFVAGEQAEAEIGAECEAMCKALAVFDPSPLGVIEGLTAVAKSGRVLSSANEAAIREAAANLNKVLASLPSAPPAGEPVAKEKGAEMPINTIDMRGRQLAQGPAADVLAKPGPVVKTSMSPDDQARDTGPVNAGGTTGMGQPRTTGPDAALPGDGPQEARPGDAPGRAVIKAALPVIVWDAAGALAGRVNPDRIVEKVAKADSDAPAKTAMQAVFDEDGNLVGIVDPADITPVAGAGGGSSDDDSDGDGDGMQAGPAAAAAPAADDMTPQPPADAGTPADAVGKAADENVITVTAEVLKSIIRDGATAALEAQGATHAEAVAKMATESAGLAEQVETLKARLQVVEESPAAPKVFTNGQVPPDSQLRGQDQGRNAPGQINVAKALERKREMYAAPDAGAQNEIAKSMQGDAIAGLQAIYAAGPNPVRVQPAPAPAAAQ